MFAKVGRLYFFYISFPCGATHGLINYRIGNFMIMEMKCYIVHSQNVCNLKLGCHVIVTLCSRIEGEKKVCDGTLFFPFPFLFY